MHGFFSFDFIHVALPQERVKFQYSYHDIILKVAIYFRIMSYKHLNFQNIYHVNIL